MANAQFTCTLHAWAEGNSIKAYFTYQHIQGLSYFYQDTALPTPTMTIAGTGYSDTSFANAVHNGVNVGTVNTTTFTKSGLANGTYTVTWSCGSGYRSDFSGTWSTQVTVSATAPPTGITVALNSRTWNSINIKASITGWGSGGSTSARSLQVLAGDTSQPSSGVFGNWPRRMTNLGNVTSGSGNVTSSSTSQGNATWYVKGCTPFKIASYATNGAADTRARNTTTYYTPPAPLASITQSQSGSNTANSVTHTIKIQGAGSSSNTSNAVTTQYRYSTNGGSSYTNWASISGTATAWTEKSFTFTSTYGASIKVQARQVYQSLNSDVKELSYTAISATAPSGNAVSVVSTTWNSVTLNASISSWGRPNNMTGRDLRPGVGANTSTYGKWNQVGAVTSISNTVVNNSSPAGSLTIKGCQTLYPFCYATNGLTSSNKWGTVFYTNPAPLQSLILSGRIMTEAGKKWQVTATVTGGNSTNNESVNVTTQYRYSTNGGSTYSSWSQVGSAGRPWTAVSGNINDLPANTTITVQARQMYQNKYSEVKTATFTTGPMAKTYVTVNGQSKLVRKIYASVNGQSVPLTKLYAGGSDGKAKLIYSSNNGRQ